MNDISIIKSGRWETDGGGGKLTLKIAADGLVTGSFKTAGGRPKPEEEFPVTGWVNGEIISFTVSWLKYRSITTWCGRYYNDHGKDTISFLWHLARQFSDEALTKPNDFAFTFHTGRDAFRYKGP